MVMGMFSAVDKIDFDFETLFNYDEFRTTQPVAIAEPVAGDRVSLTSVSSPKQDAPLNVDAFRSTNANEGIDVNVDLFRVTTELLFVYDDDESVLLAGPNALFFDGDLGLIF